MQLQWWGYSEVLGHSTPSKFLGQEPKATTKVTLQEPPRIVADPGFPRGDGANSFAKNCMKMKEFGLRLGQCSRNPLGSTTEKVYQQENILVGFIPSTWKPYMLQFQWPPPDVTSMGVPRYDFQGRKVPYLTLPGGGGYPTI